MKVFLIGLLVVTSFALIYLLGDIFKTYQDENAFIYDSINQNKKIYVEYMIRTIDDDKCLIVGSKVMSLKGLYYLGYFNFGLKHIHVFQRVITLKNRACYIIYYVGYKDEPREVRIVKPQGRDMGLR